MTLRRKPLKRSYFKKHKKIIDLEEIKKMRDFFLSIWKKRKHQSEISGDKLYEINGLPSSAYFHHILPKEHYPEAKYDEENIILLSMEEHANVHSDMYRYEEINKRRERLLKKY
jgi:5-methylcytosine-specific restriction endonuclease McrA